MRALPGLVGGKGKLEVGEVSEEDNRLKISTVPGEEGWGTSSHTMAPAAQQQGKATGELRRRGGHWGLVSLFQTLTRLGTALLQ